MKLQAGPRPLQPHALVPTEQQPMAKDARAPVLAGSRYAARKTEFPCEAVTDTGSPVWEHVTLKVKLTVNVDVPEPCEMLNAEPPAATDRAAGATGIEDVAARPLAVIAIVPAPAWAVNVAHGFQS